MVLIEKLKKNLLKRFFGFYEINKRYINLEFVNDNITANIVAKEKIGNLDESKMTSCYNKYFTKPFKVSESHRKILNKMRELGEKILEREVSLEEIIPDLRDKFHIDNKDIVIAIGSTDRKKVCSPLKIKEYIEEILKFYPEEKIILVGNGNYKKNMLKK